MYNFFLFCIFKLCKNDWISSSTTSSTVIIITNSPNNNNDYILIVTTQSTNNNYDHELPYRERIPKNIISILSVKLLKLTAV